MVRLRVHRAADELSIDRRSAPLRMTEPLDDHHGRAFSHDEAIASEIEGAAGLCWVNMVREHPHLQKAGGKQRVKGFAASGERDLALPIANGTHGGQDIDQPAGACGGVTDSWTS